MKATPSYFLNSSERAEFDLPGRRTARKATLETDEGTRANTPDPLLVAEYMAGSVNAKLVGGGGTHCRLLAVDPDDGMSWAAESIARALARADAKLCMYCFRDSRGAAGPPAVASVAGMRRVIAAAARRGILPGRMIQSPRFAITLVTLAFIAQLIGTAVKPPAAREGTDLLVATMVALIDPLTILTALAAVAFAIGTKIAASSFVMYTQADAWEKLTQRIEGNPADVAVDSLLDDVASLLLPRFRPRVVVIDNWANLDTLSKLAILRSLERCPKDGTPLLAWVILESSESLELSRTLGAVRWPGLSQRLKRLRLCPLMEKEREALAAVVGHPERSQYATVKAICRGGIDSNSDAFRYLLDARENEPSRTGRLTLLNFLALIATGANPGKLQLPEKFLIRYLSRKPSSTKPPLETELLAELFPGLSWRREDLRALCESAERLLGHLAAPEGLEPHCFAPPQETNDLLRRHHQDLSIVDPAHLELYWAIFWHARKKNLTCEGYWIRKISSHLLAANVPPLSSPSLLAQVEDRLIDALLYCIEGSVRLCDLERIGPLCLNLADSLNDAESLPAPRLRRALRTLWHAYSATGSDRILAAIVEMAEVSGALAALPKRVEEDPLGDLLSELVEAREERDRLHMRPLFEIRFGPERRLEAAALFARARAGYWSLVASRQLTGTSRSLIVRSATQACAEAHTTVERAAERIVSTDDLGDLAVTDAAALVLGAWSMLVSKAVGIAPLAADVVDRIEAHREPKSDIDSDIGWLRSMLGAAESAILAGWALQRRSEASLKESGGVDFMMNALSREVGATSTACLVSSLLLLPGGPRDSVPKREATRILDAFREGMNLVGLANHEPPGLSSLASEATVTRIDEALHLCYVLWRTMGLPHLAENLAIHHLAFTELTTPLRESILVDRDSAISLLSNSLNEPSFEGILANLYAASLETESSEMVGHWVRRCADLSLARNYGATVRRELCAAAIHCNSGVNANRCKALHYLTADSGPLQFVAWYLDFWDRSEPEAVFLSLCNAAQPRESPLGLEHLRTYLEFRFPDGSPEDVAGRLWSILSLYEVNAAAASGDVRRAAELIDNWSWPRDTWVYAAALRGVLQTPQPHSDTILSEATSAIASGWGSSFNSYYLLANTICDSLEMRSKSHPAFSAALTYLQFHASQFESTCSPEINIGAYEILLRNTPSSRSFCLSKLEFWNEFKLRLDYYRRLPELAADGQHFLIFYELCSALQLWGLRIQDGGGDQSPPIARLDPMDETEVNTLANSGHQPLVATLSDHAGGAVSAQFLRFGRGVLRLEEDHPSVRELRAAVNAEAQAILHGFLQQVVLLRDLPASVRKLLEEFSNRFEPMKASPCTLEDLEGSPHETENFVR